MSLDHLTIAPHCLILPAPTTEGDDPMTDPNDWLRDAHDEGRVPPDVVPSDGPARPLNHLIPGSVVTFTIPGRVLIDAEGVPEAMTEPQSWEMTVTDAGALVGWVPRDGGDAL